VNFDTGVLETATREQNKPGGLQEVNFDTGIEQATRERN